jgi:hypothetical protein
VTPECTGAKMHFYLKGFALSGIEANQLCELVATQQKIKTSGQLRSPTLLLSKTLAYNLYVNDKFLTGDRQQILERNQKMGTMSHEVTVQGMRLKKF